MAAERLGLEPRKCFAIEDAEKGVISAHEAGMKVIVVETAVTAGVSIDGADLHLPGLGALRRAMLESGMK
jgi:beta-phosphoglucomutase-like phosphatase (HAD superfamily)